MLTRVAKNILVFRSRVAKNVFFRSRVAKNVFAFRSRVAKNVFVQYCTVHCSLSLYSTLPVSFGTANYLSLPYSTLIHLCESPSFLADSHVANPSPPSLYMDFRSR